MKSSRTSLLAQIHILKKEIGMNDLEYVTCLEQWTGKSSCSNMDCGELKGILHRMRLVSSAVTPNQRPAKDDYPPGCSAAQWRKIKWLQRKLRWNDRNLRGYIKHVTKREHERFLDVASARQVIAGLVRIDKAPRVKELV